MTVDSGFRDHFSGHADAYARFRPVYPPRLFAWLASVAPGHERAWDCATGNGQAARGLAPHFREVVATDASAEQLRSAAPHPGVVFRVAAAESSGLEDASVDLVTVAQALHWFDLPRFFAEAARTLRPGGVVAAWCYVQVAVSAEVDAVVARLYGETVGPFWPPERALVEDGYRSLALPPPFVEVDAPELAMEARWTLSELLGYLGTWSAAQRYRRATGRDAVVEVSPELGAAWGPAGEVRTVRWPLQLRAARRE